MASNSTIIVTGATGNLGRAVVAVLSGRGHRVVAVAHGEQAPGAGEAIRLAADLGDPGAVQALVRDVVTRFGAVDGVAHTVGGFAYAPAAESGAELFQRMFQLNLLTTVNLFQAVLPAMRSAGRGSLVAVGAAGAARGAAGMSAYAAAKSGVLRYVESLAEETKADGIRVNAVLPSIIDTPPNRASMPKADASRWVTPEQVAEVIAFLLSDQASGITGAGVPVSGRV